ncbi:MAG: ribbon-helix-helix domain-containing protein [Fervidobacterium sp.]
MPRKKYRMIGLPEELYLEIERIVDAGKYGYASVSEFVKDAVRRRLEEIAKLKETKTAK